MAVGQNRVGHFGVFGAPHILEPILVVGLGCSLGVRDFDPWPYFKWLWADRLNAGL